MTSMSTAWNRLLSVLVGFVLLVCLANAASATDYYVSTTGNNENSGESIAQAWRNVSYGMVQLSAGDTLYVINGTYLDDGYHIQIATSGTAANPITVTAYNGTPMLQTDEYWTCGRGPGVYSEWVDFNSHDYWNISGLAFRNYDGFDIAIGSNIHLDNIDYQNFGAALTISMGSGGGSENNSLTNSIIAGAIDCREPNQDTYFANTSYAWNSIQLQGMYGGTAADASHNILIKNNSISDNDLHGLIDMIGYQYDITIIDNTIFDTSYSAIYIHGNTGINEVMERINFSNNEMYDIRASNVLYAYWHDSILQDNVFRDIEVDGNFILTSTSGPTSFGLPDNMTFINNTITDNITSTSHVYINMFAPGVRDTWIAGVEQEHTFTGDSTWRNNSISDYEMKRNATATFIDNKINYTIWLDQGAISIVEFNDNTIFTATTSSNSDYYKDETEVLYYPTKSNFSVSAAGASYALFEIDRYDMTLTPDSGYAKDVVLNIDNVDDVSNFTANFTESTTIDVTFAVDNATNTYNLSVNGVYNTNAVSNSDGIVEFTKIITDAESTDFEVTWASTEGDTPNPAITSWQNNKTSNNTLTFTINTTENVNFNVTANQSIDTWTWNIDAGHNYDNITWHWDTTGDKTVIVDGINANGTSNDITWTVTVQNEWEPTANTTYQGIMETWYTNGTRAWLTDQPTESDAVVERWWVIPS